MHGNHNSSLLFNVCMSQQINIRLGQRFIFQIVCIILNRKKITKMIMMMMMIRE